MDQQHFHQTNGSRSHFKGIKEEDGAQEVPIAFPSSDNAKESSVARYNATVAELARLCQKT